DQKLDQTRHGVGGAAGKPSMSTSDYCDRQRERDAEYREACDAWLATATPEQIRESEEMGLIRRNPKTGAPILADCGHDPADDLCREDDAMTLFGNSKVMGIEPDMAEAVDKLADILAER